MATSIRASATETVERGIDEVFAYVSDFRAMDEWVGGVSNVRAVSETEAAVGDVYEYDYTYGRRTVPMRVTVTAFERPTRIEMRSVKGPFPYESELTLDGSDEVTRVTNTIVPGSDGRFTTALFTLFGPVLRWRMKRRLAAELDGLKEIVESRPVAADPAEAGDSADSSVASVWTNPSRAVRGVQM